MVWYGMVWYGMVCCLPRQSTLHHLQVVVLDLVGEVQEDRLVKDHLGALRCRLFGDTMQDLRIGIVMGHNLLKSICTISAIPN